MPRSRTLRLPFRATDDAIARSILVVLTGLAGGATAMALFIVIHSLLIFPLWNRMGSGVPLALMGGVGLAVAFDRAARHTRWRSVRGGAVFGALMFTTVAPATLFSNALRLAGLSANGWPATTGVLAIALASGAAAGWFVVRRRDGAIAFAAATLALTAAMAGPIPVVNGPRAAWLFAGFLPICVCAGAALALARASLVGEEPS